MNRHAFIAMNAGLNPQSLLNRLRDEGFKILNIDELPQYDVINIIWTDGMEKVSKHINSLIYAVKCDLKNHVDNTASITNKCQLHFASELQAFIAPTINITDGADKDLIAPYLPAIIRPSNGFAGLGITIIDSYNELPVAIKKAHSEVFKKNLNQVLLSKYYTDVWLFDGKKCHQRVYMVVYVIGKDRGFAVWNRAELFTSKLKYHPDARDKAHTDTHGKSTIGDIDIAEMESRMSSEMYKNMRKQMYEICATIAQIALLPSNIQPYKESAYGFELWACDMLTLNDGTVKLIEVNDKPGFHFNSGPEFTNQFSAELIDWLWDVAISKYIAMI